MSTPGPDLASRITHLDGEVVIALTGEFDVATIPDLVAAVESVTGAYTKTLVIDARELTFVGLAGLRSLADITVALGARDIPVRVTGLSDLALRVIQVAELSVLDAVSKPERSDQL